MFRNITRAEAGSYLLDIVCKDYDFLGYGVDVVDAKGEEEDRPVVEVYRVGRGGVEMGERVKVGEGGVEVRVLRAREYYEARSGCKWPRFCLGCGWGVLMCGVVM